MKSMKLAAVVALLVGGTALGQTDTISFELELGGYNEVDSWELWPSVVLPFLPGTPANDQAFDQGDIVTWDVVVYVSGQWLEPGDPPQLRDTNGAANLVFNLELRTWDGAPGDLVPNSVGPVTTRFLSTMNDGDRGNWPGGVPPDPDERAAFCHIYDVDNDATNPPYDQVDAYLPEFNKYGAEIYGSPHNEPPVDLGLLGTGRLWDPAASGGPYLDRAQYPSTKSHGGGRDTQADPPGYKAVGGATSASEGQLVGMGAGYSQFTYGTNTAGVGLEFSFLSCTPDFERGLGFLPVFEGQIDTAGLDGQYCLVLVPGTGNNILRSFCPEPANPGQFAAAATNVAVVNANNCIVFEVVPPAVATYYSVRDHGAKGELYVELDAAATGDASTCEPRQGGVQKIRIEFSGDVSAYYVADQISLTGGISVAGGTEVLIGGTVLEFGVTGTVDASCYGIDITNSIPGADPDYDRTCELRVLAGNTNDGTTTDLVDMADVKSRNGDDPTLPGNARYDVNVGGSIDLVDAALVKSLNGGSLSCP